MPRRRRSPAVEDVRHLRDTFAATTTPNELFTPRVREAIGEDAVQAVEDARLARRNRSRRGTASGSISNRLQ